MSTFFQNMPQQHGDRQAGSDGKPAAAEKQEQPGRDDSRHNQILQLKSEYGDRIASARGMERESLVREMARRILELVASRPRHSQPGDDQSKV
jgi:ribosome-binding protein aMBF1 (putative translation factor)